MTEARAGAGLQLDARVHARDFDAAVHVAPGEVVAVLGPNGSGKSTLLALIAGLLRPDEGRVVLDGDVLADAGTGGWLPPHRRGTALLAQQALLFPHLDVTANVEFAPRSRGASRATAREEAQHWLQRVKATDLAHRRPAELSGGQAQRVAVARALAARPRLLLLDEPLAALDVATAPLLRRLLRQVLREDERSALLVTHDVLDVVTLADRVIVIEAGRVVEQGPAREVLTQPRSTFAARIAGVNLVTGTATADGLRQPDGRVLTGLRAEDATPGESAVAVFSPSAVAVHLDLPGGSPRNAMAVTITELEPRGAVVRVRASSGQLSGGSSTQLFADITAAAVADLNLAPGLPVHFVVKATEVAIHPTRRN